MYLYPLSSIYLVICVSCSCIPSELKTFVFFNTSILQLFFLNSMPMPLLDVCTVYTRLSSCSLNNNCLVSYIIQILKEINCLLKKFSFDLYSSLYLAIQCQLHSPNSHAVHQRLCHLIGYFEFFKAFVFLCSTTS